MGFEKDLEKLNKHKSIRCSSKTSKYIQGGVVVSKYLDTHICPYFDIKKQNCTLNACIRGGIENGITEDRDSNY